VSVSPDKKWCQAEPHQRVAVLALTLKTSVEVQCYTICQRRVFLILKYMLEIGKFGQRQKEKRGVGGQ